MKNKEVLDKLDKLNEEAHPYIGDFKTSYMEEKEQERLESHIKRKAFQRRSVKNLLITTNIVLISIPFILGTAAGIGTYKALSEDSKYYHYVYYVDSEGTKEIVDYDLDNKEMFVKSPWKEDNGKITRKIYSYPKTVYEKDLDEYLEKSWDELLADKHFNFIRDEENTEVKSINELKSNNGVVGCTVELKTPKTKEEIEKTRSSDKTSNIGSAIAISLAAGVGVFAVGAFIELFTERIEKRRLKAKRIEANDYYIQRAKELKKKK